MSCGPSCATARSSPTDRTRLELKRRADGGDARRCHRIANGRRVRVLPGHRASIIVDVPAMGAIADVPAYEVVRIEALAEEAGRTQDPDQLTALVRPRLGRMIAQTLCAEDGTLQVMTLDPALEKMLHGAVSQSGAAIMRPRKSPRLQPQHPSAIRQRRSLCAHGVRHRRALRPSDRMRHSSPRGGLHNRAWH